MIYEQPPFESEETTLLLVAHGSVDDVCSALIGAALHSPEPGWVEALCLDVARQGDDREDHVIPAAAALGLAHLARRFHHLDDPAAARAVLADLDHIPALAGRLSDVRDDFEMFLPN